MLILGLTLQAWITILLIIGMFVVLLRTRLPSDIVFLVVMALLLVTGCLPANEVLGSFSSEMVVIFGALFVVVAGLEATGVLQWIVKYLLGQPSSYWRAIVRLMLPVAALSGFLSNATIVVLFIKVVRQWADKLHITPSKLLIPLSYAAGMGGVCTLIGTAPNLIISGFYSDATGDSLGIFVTAIPGLVCLAVGVLSVIMLQRLLPSRKAPDDEFRAKAQGAVRYLYVPKGNAHIGRTLSEIKIVDYMNKSRFLGVVHFDGEIEHADEMLPEQMGDIFIMGGDTLLFSGDRDEVQGMGNLMGFSYDAMDHEEKIQGGWRTAFSTFIMLAMVLVSTFKVLSLLHCSFIAALLLLFTRCCSIQQAKRAINWDLLMIFACSITLGKAIDATGLAQLLADHMVDISGSNPVIAFIIVCTLGTFLTEFVSNTACGAIMAPVAISIANMMGVNPLTFCIGLMISVSSSFATPIGSGTHILVYVAGGYRFSDFIRIGLPMNFIILATNIIVTLLVFPL